MKRNLLALTIAALAGTAAAGTVTTEGPDLVIGSKGGLGISTADGNFSFNLGGRLMWDNDYFDGVHSAGRTAANDGDFTNDNELRRSRLELKGTVYGDWHYKLVYTFNEPVNSGNKLEDAYIMYSGFSLADVTVGRFKVPFGLEELTSSKYISTIERSVMFEFVPAGRNHQNLQLSHGGSNYSWRAGLYESADDDEGSAQYGFGTRGTFNPVIGDNYLIHLGAAYLQNELDDNVPNNFDFDQRLAVHTAEKVQMTADVPDAEDQDQLGLEAAWLSGPFSVQGEYVMSTVDSVSGGDVDYDGFYVQGTWTLTGESRGYKAKNGVFDKIKPQGHYGAWELVAKYEKGEIDDGRDPLVVPGATDNEFDILTLGVNWYANQNVRVSFNYLMAEIDEKTAPFGEDDGNAFSTRLQLTW